MSESASSYSPLDDILEKSRRRLNELDAEYEEGVAAIQAEIEEREREIEEKQAEYDRKEAERREAEQAAARERARKEQLSFGEAEDDDPFAGKQPISWGAPSQPQAMPESQYQAQAQPHSAPAADSRWQVQAGRFGRQEQEEAARPEPEPAAPPAPPRPAPRRRPAFDDDWDDDDDFSQRSWLR
ncbi:hypothetical protein [Haloactinomyces albus]|uniref:Septal ring factor EnvC (AmiA/AmiB activator) n=1 Tax=Haloactinomyces albus TaxID=1352928 RepID=A0AAE3ZEQ0_9ACTN|nr:hypothetical protein [Haloactinomyces albus]MDR7302520.1 septal ring factor EnvC (AmiA/AmiB activator) [Haloactinomyces albus]